VQDRRPGEQGAEQKGLHRTAQALQPLPDGPRFSGHYPDLGVDQVRQRQLLPAAFEVSEQLDLLLVKGTQAKEGRIEAVVQRQQDQPASRDQYDGCDGG
jgi:hypothetical protein